MDFRGLQDNLRRLLTQRIHAGQLTGMQLARQAGFQQAHICNFLHSKRGLSLDALDRVLSVQHLSVLDLLDQAELSRFAKIPPPARGQFENVVLVDADSAASRPRFTRDLVLDVFKVRKRLLRSLRPAMATDRSRWQRFIFIRAGAREGLSMYPRLLPGAYVLLDRHYNSLRPYVRNERNMYAVVHNGHCFLRYVEQKGAYLVLHAENRTYSTHALPLCPGDSPLEGVAGRVCSLQINT
jgi:hypothetical protein